MLKNIFLIVILLAIFQLALADANDLQGPWIVSNVAGKKFKLGEKLLLKVRCPKSVDHLDSINILQRGASFNTSLLSNVKVCPGLNKIWLTLPVNGSFSAPSPQNYIAIFLGGRRVDYSATFRIGNPNFGVTFEKPCAGETLHPGDTLIAKWKGKFGNGFVFAWGLFEPTSNFSLRPRFFYPNEISFSKGKFSYKLPADFVTGALWKFGFRANGTNGAIEIFSAGTFYIK
jgi:hypothetical protein